MGTKSKKTICISAIMVVILVAFDQITKQLAVHFLKGKAAFPIIKDVFELQYLENRSAAFGMDPISLLHKIFSFDAFNKYPQLFLNVKMCRVTWMYIILFSCEADIDHSYLSVFFLFSNTIRTTLLSGGEVVFISLLICSTNTDILIP